MEIIIGFVIALPVSYALIHSIYAYSIKKKFAKKSKDYYMSGFNDGVQATDKFNNKRLMQIIEEKLQKNKE